MPDLSHLWQRFVLTATLFVGLLIGVVSTVFGYDNKMAVSVHLWVLHIDNIPLWTVAVVPVAITLVASTLYHWMDGLHHFTEHMRHRRLVHDLETEVKSLRAHLDHVLEMPGHGGEGAQRSHGARLPAADEGFTDLGPSAPDDLSELAGEKTPALAAPGMPKPAAKAAGKPSKSAEKRRARKKRSAKPRVARATLKSAAEPVKASAGEKTDVRGPFIGADGEALDLEEEGTAQPATPARRPRQEREA